MLNFSLYLFENQSLKRLVLARQQVFANAARGGLFLEDHKQLLRLDPDTSLVTATANHKLFKVKKNVPYVYWEHSHQHDTLACTANLDTVTVYQLVDFIPPGGSNIALTAFTGNQFPMLCNGFYYSLFYPFFFNAKGPFQNAGLHREFIDRDFAAGIFMGHSFNPSSRLLPVVFMLLGLLLCLITGLTTPNSGAIFRYRSPGCTVILLSALYYIAPLRHKLFHRPD